MPQSKINIIHVDDEPGFIRHFKKMLSAFPNIQYEAALTSADAALEYLDENDAPDLIFMDIEMPGHDGMWLANKIADRKIKVVFLTSHTEYALQAFEVCAIDYLQKPPDEERLHRLIEKITSEKEIAPDTQELQIETVKKFLTGNERPNRIFINMVGNILVIKLDDVMYFSSNNNYTTVFTESGERHTASKTIKTYEDALRNHPDFFRVSRSFIINKNFINSIQRNAKSRKITITMEGDEIIETSFKTKEEVMMAIKGNEV
jgi:two-component system LytT family response regulator